jgi:hypothetical protein
MHPYRTTSRAVGALILLSYVGVFAGAALMAPALDKATALSDVHAHKTGIVIGGLLEFVNDACVIGIAVLLFPLLKRAGEGLALWYVGLRIVEGVMYAVGVASVLAISSLAGDSVVAGDPASLESGRSVAIGLFEGAGTMATVAFIVAAMMLYLLLFRSRIVPRFIAIWGLVAVPLVAIVNVIAPDISKASAPVMLLVVPMITNELFLAGWLLVKGVRVHEGAASTDPTK